jgi:hypothetical protein
MHQYQNEKWGDVVFTVELSDTKKQKQKRPGNQNTKQFRSAQKKQERKKIHKHINTETHIFT